jgi:hypothetical protein
MAIRLLITAYHSAPMLEAHLLHYRHAHADFPRS